MKTWIKLSFLLAVRVKLGLISKLWGPCFLPSCGLASSLELTLHSRLLMCSQIPDCSCHIFTLNRHLKPNTSKCPKFPCQTSSSRLFSVLPYILLRPQTPESALIPFFFLNPTNIIKPDLSRIQMLFITSTTTALVYAAIIKACIITTGSWEVFLLLHSFPSPVYSQQSNSVIPLKQLSMPLKHKALRIAQWALYSLCVTFVLISISCSSGLLLVLTLAQHAPASRTLHFCSCSLSGTRAPDSRLVCSLSPVGSVIEAHLPWASFFKQQLFFLEHSNPSYFSSLLLSFLLILE